MHELELNILKRLAEPDYQPKSVRRLAEDLDIPAELYPRFRKAVNSLKKSGKVHSARGKLSLAAGGGVITGTLQSTRHGYGFVRPVGVGEREDDVFVNANAMNGALDGDTVSLEVTQRSGPKNQRSGSVVEVLRRSRTAFVGTYKARGQAAAVEVPMAGSTVIFHVAKPAQQEVAKGTKVVVHLDQYDSKKRRFEGTLGDILGLPGQARVDLEIIRHEFDLPGEFPEAVLEEVETLSHMEFDVENRKDFRDVPTITIDPADARDFDDAVSIERHNDGTWRLMVHIADVSAYVTRGSRLDREALHRGTSVYLPGEVVPMLPEALSNDLCSLRPNVDRMVKSVVMTFDASGKRTRTTVHHAVIRSDRRLNYDQVWQVIQGNAAVRDDLGEATCSLVDDALLLARKLGELRYRAGSLTLDLPEGKIQLHPDGSFKAIGMVEQNWAHRLIEEFMVAANVAVAEYMARHHLPILNRYHGEPDPEDAAELSFFAQQVGLEVGKLQTHRDYQKLVESVQGRPISYAVNMALLRSLQKAVYDPERKGHFALAVEDYCHFTSPIRRYPDLVVHQVLDEALSRTVTAKLRRQLASGIDGKAEQSNTTERRAQKAEREMYALKVLTHLSTRLGERFAGVITGVAKFGLFVQLEEFLTEGLVSMDALSDDYYELEQGGNSLRGRRTGRRYTLGDEVTVVVVKVDLDQRKMDLQFPAAASDKKTGGRRRRRRR